MIYIVTMYRYGDRSAHSYVLGAFSTPEKADAGGDKESLYRGGNKYGYEVVPCELDLDSSHIYTAGIKFMGEF